MEDELDVEAALRKDKGHMGKRYIEVFESQVTGGHYQPACLLNIMKYFQHSEMEYACNTRAGQAGADECSEDAVVKLRGLPYDSSKEQIADFFQGRSRQWPALVKHCLQAELQCMNFTLGTSEIEH